tara:strand:- start:5744 stop:6823 length:1080 start_codon:yes stop_codon:yes gene_type:complete
MDFPREVMELSENGTGGRWVVNNWPELERYWKDKNGRGNAYMSVYGYRQTHAPKHTRAIHNSAIVRHFVMDFDCKDFHNKGRDVEFSYMQEQVRRLHNHFIDNDYEHYLWFTGGGFHIWMTLDDTYLPIDGSDVTQIKSGGRMLMHKWREAFNTTCNDPTVAFDLAGMIRIPNSYNYRRKCWTTPLTSKELMTLGEDELWELAQTFRGGYIKQGSKSIKMILPEKRNKGFSRTKKQVSDLPTVSLGKLVVLPCIAHSALGEGNPTHRSRYHLASYLADRLRWFFPIDNIPQDELPKHVEQIVQICSEQGWADWNEDITTQQVESIVFKGYPHARCDTLIQEGLCVGKCRFYDGTGDGLI